MNPDEIAEPMIDSSSASRRISLVWLVPIVAALLGMWLAYQHFTQLGPRITLTFESAQGLKAGKTEIRYREVSVGKVEKFYLDAGLERVRVVARMVAGFDEYLTEGSRFWVERPRVGAGGISGLATIVSGAYIQVDPVKEGDYREFFHGLEEPPLRRNNAAGLRLTLSAEQAGSVQIGSPIYYRQVRVGQVEARRFSDDYSQVEFDLFIESPHHKLISGNSRFWNVSGVEVTLDSSGVKVQMESLETLVYGGIAFAQLGSSEEPQKIVNGAQFPLFTDRQAAASEADQGEDEPGMLDGLQQQLDQLLKKFNDLPLEPLLTTSTATLHTLNLTLKEMQLPKLTGSANRTFKNVNALLTNSEVRHLPADLRATVQQLNKTLLRTETSMQELSPESNLYLEMSNTLVELQEASRAVQDFVDGLEQKPNSLIFGR